MRSAKDLSSDLEIFSSINLSISDSSEIAFICENIPTRLRIFFVNLILVTEGGPNAKNPSKIKFKKSVKLTDDSYAFNS